MLSHPGHLEDAPDGTLTLWSGPPLPPELAEAHARLNQRAWLIALPLSVLLALLAYDASALDLECSRELHGCTSRHLFNDELHPLRSLGTATVEQRDAGRTRNQKRNPYFAVLVPGLSERSGPSGDAVFTSGDQAEARSVAQAFNAFRAGRATEFSAHRDGLAWTTAIFAFVGTLLVTALLVGMLRGPNGGAPSLHLRLTPHHVTLQPLPTPRPTLSGRPGRDTVYRLRMRWPLDELGSFEVRPTPGRGAFTLQAVSPDHGAYEVLEGEPEQLQPLADAFNLRLEHLRAHRLYG